MVVFLRSISRVGLFVCYSAMSRIVYKQTVLIGTKKAMGFTRSEITNLFALYAASAVAIGVLLAIPVSILAVEAISLRALNSYFVVSAGFNFVLRDLILLALLEAALIMVSTWLAVHDVLARQAVELLAVSVVYQWARAYAEG
ncbi:MAG: FtsX-like permease family protein [Atopobiaceae bacterium]|nr:FtsX-like permease family protein [Atopobiaceae bacterium]